MNPFDPHPSNMPSAPLYPQNTLSTPPNNVIGIFRRGLESAIRFLDRVESVPVEKNTVTHALKTIIKISITVPVVLVVGTILICKAREIYFCQANLIQENSPWNVSARYSYTRISLLKIVARSSRDVIAWVFLTSGGLHLLWSW